MNIVKRLAMQYAADEITDHEAFEILKRLNNPTQAQHDFWNFVEKFSGYSYPQKGEE